jgi:hypothetical protein
VDGAGQDAASGRMTGGTDIGLSLVLGALSMQEWHVYENGAHMIVWTGRGILIFLILIAAVFVAIPFVVIEIDPVYKFSTDQGTSLAIALAALLSAILTFPLDRFIMKQRGPKILIDPKTGQQQLVSNKDTFMWIETRYWPYLYLALGAVMLVVVYFT